MADISNAVGAERVSRIVGYQITKGSYSEGGVNLPMRVAVLGAANHANQAGLGLDPSPAVITSANEAAELYGYGSPLHQMARILRPLLGGGIGGIPTVFYPQLEAAGATASSIDIAVSGTATKNVAHRLRINGRTNVDGEYYEFVVTPTDDAAAIRAKIIDCVNNVTNAPVIASSSTTYVRLTTKWYGATSAELTVAVDTMSDSSGLTYTVSNKVSGTGSESIANALAKFGSNWNTIVINPYGSAQFAALEAFNGTPSVATPTGRYTGIIFKPFIALYGSVESDKDTIAAITNASGRLNQVTNVHCPAPNSEGFTWEAAANVARLVARKAQDAPHQDVNGEVYPDMPVPVNGLIGDMADYENRDYLVKNGSSTVDLVNGVYEIQDLVTTYHPAGEIPPQFRYTRNLILDWNVRYGYLLKELVFVKDKAIAQDADFVTAANVIKPKQWKAVLFEYFADLSARALISDVSFSKDSLEVDVPSTNPDRLDTFFRYKRTGTVRIASTTAEANFAY